MVNPPSKLVMQSAQIAYDSYTSDDENCNFMLIRNNYKESRLISITDPLGKYDISHLNHKN